MNKNIVNLSSSVLDPTLLYSRGDGTNTGVRGNNTNVTVSPSDLSSNRGSRGDADPTQSTVTDDGRGNGTGTTDNPRGQVVNTDAGKDGALNGGESGKRSDLEQAAFNSAITNDGISDDGTIIDASQLSNSLDNILTMMFNGDLGNSGQMIGQLLSQLQNYFKSAISGLNNDEATSLVSSVTSMLQSYLSGIYNNLYARQNWILENEYNSPKNQIQRLMDAGINPAFYYGALGTSDGSQISSSGLQSQGLSYQGQSQLSDGMQNFISGAEGASSLAGVALQAIGLPSQIKQAKSVAALNFSQSKSLETLRPLEVGLYHANAAAAWADARMKSSSSIGQELTNDITRYSMPDVVRSAGLNNQKTVSETNLNDEKARSERMGQYASWSSIEQGWEQISLGYANIQANLEMKASDLALGYYKANVDEIANYFTQFKTAIEREIYLEEDLTSGKVQEIDAGAMPLNIGGKLDETGSFTVNGKRYSKRKVTSSVIDAQSAGKFFGMFLKLRDISGKGQLKKSPEEVERILSDGFHIMDHLTKYCDDMQIERFSNYTMDKILELSEMQIEPQVPVTNNGTSW